MEISPSHIIIFFLSITLMIIINPNYSFASDPSCKNTCGSLQIKYPFGTAYGCGSPKFNSFISCSTTQNKEQLLLKTHTGFYPITSISYSTSTITLSPNDMSTCSSMKLPQHNLGLDWASPFQLGPSTFILLSCQPPTSSLTLKGSPMCDTSYSHLCASIYTCSSVVELGLPLFPPTNTCCVYAPANFDSKDELDLHGLKCSGYTSLVSLGDYPTDPVKWIYGVELKYNYGGLDNNLVETKCNSCEMSGGVCGYSTNSYNSFLCVCKNGFNTTMDCNSYNPANQGVFWSSASLPNCKFFFFWTIVLLLLLLIVD